MGILKPLGQGQGWLKGGFLGFQKSGKTFTAIDLLIGTRKFFGDDSPIVMFDTEGGSEYIAEAVKERTGVELIGVRSRSFTDLMETAKEVEREGVRYFLVDSITHPWRELCDAYLEQVNQKRAQKRLPKRYSLEFQDWNPIKARWSQWTDWYLNSPVHVVICGRAGFEYDKEENQETGKKELVKTGIKMKTEGEFGFEPSLLVEMERVQQLEPRLLVNRATVLGDRFDVINAKSCDSPTFEFFRPHVERLKKGAHAPVNTEIKTDMGIDDNLDDNWTREKKQRAILCEEIQGELVAKYPGQTASEKQAKVDAIFEVFGTRSWTKVESMDSAYLADGLKQIRARLNPTPADADANATQPF